MHAHATILKTILQDEQGRVVREGGRPPVQRAGKGSRQCENVRRNKHNGLMYLQYLLALRFLLLKIMRAPNQRLPELSSPSRSSAPAPRLKMRRCRRLRPPHVQWENSAAARPVTWPRRSAEDARGAGRLGRICPATAQARAVASAGKMRLPGCCWASTVRSV